jgi:hypothetical protein
MVIQTLSAVKDEGLVLTLLRALFAGRALGDGACYEQAANLLRQHVGPAEAPVLFGLTHALALEFDVDAPRPVDWRPVNCRCPSHDEQIILDIISAAQRCDAQAIMMHFGRLGYQRCPNDLALAAGRLADALRNADIFVRAATAASTIVCAHAAACSPKDFQVMMKDLKPC